MKIKVDIISGFLGAGKTTLINKLLEMGLGKERIAVIENEFGKVGIDGNLLERKNVSIRELTSGCICCSLAEDLDKTLEDICTVYKPDRIIIEPTGIGKLSDIIQACEKTKVREQLEINSLITVVNILKFKMLNEGFGDFFQNQIINAHVIILSRIEKVEEVDTVEIIEEIRKINPHAEIISVPMESIDVCGLVARGKCTFKKTLNCFFESQKDNHMEHGNRNASLQTWGIETNRVFEERELRIVLESIGSLGDIVRGKGILQLKEGPWLQFDFVQGELTYKHIERWNIGKVSFIGKLLNTIGLSDAFS